jgi:hypothetical protein
MIYLTNTSVPCDALGSTLDGEDGRPARVENSFVLGAPQGVTRIVMVRPCHTGSNVARITITARFGGQVMPLIMVVAVAIVIYVILGAVIKAAGSIKVR